ncbi:MAG: SusD/RagB family nutrient-binding outer membrane lipoprotein [Bacteroidales bacterium]|nr:SusD/RagB family nutrient-binding outer membrane lipoprotein [Bacteroidales bacterium]
MKKIFTIIAVAALSLTSCKDYLDINKSPNSPGEDLATVDMVMPAAEMALCARYGDLYRIIGGYLAEHYAQCFGTSNYLGYSQFTVGSTSSTNAYTDLNRAAIANATFVRDKAAESEAWGTYIAATCIRVFTYQALVDAYGETPYSEANQGKDNLSPKFDEGKDIYAGLVEELDYALSKASASLPVATNFLYEGEDATNWIKFANALKLKILMRERAVSGVSVDSAITALVEEGNFPTADVAWTHLTTNESGKANPFYQEEFASYFGSTQVNCGLNVALYKALDDCGDARLAAFFSKNSSNAYWGSISGYNMSTSDNYKSGAFCRPNVAYDDPVYLISLSEINFFLAEYYQKVKNDATKAKDYYEAAVKASFATAGLTDSDAAVALAAYPYSAANSDKYIGIQKWIALSGINSFEAWCEMRRIGYPAFGGKKAEDIYNFTGDNLNASALTAGELYTPYKVDTQVGSSSLVQRWPYAQASINYNSNCPDVKSMSEKVFWAK